MLFEIDPKRSFALKAVSFDFHTYTPVIKVLQKHGLLNNYSMIAAGKQEDGRPL